MTRGGPRYGWRTRSARTSRSCGRRCCPACCGPWRAISAAASPTSRCIEFGLIFRPRPEAPPVAPILRVDRGPTAQEIAQLEAALPDQPLHVGAVLTGNVEPAGYWGPGRPAGWQDAIEAARVILRASRVSFEIRADQYEPWHPGRCAAIVIRNDRGDEWLAGHAGELHPRVISAFGLPARTSAMELDLSVIETAADSVGPVQAPVLSAYPVAAQDVALVVPQAVPAADVERAPQGRSGRGRRCPAGVADAVRRLHRRSGRRGTQVAGVHAAVPRARPDADGRRGRPRPGTPPSPRRPGRPAPSCAAADGRAGLDPRGRVRRGGGARVPGQLEVLRIARISVPFLAHLEASPVFSSWGVEKPWQVQPEIATGAPPPLPGTCPSTIACA